jgi:hypothetical protein
MLFVGVLEQTQKHLLLYSKPFIKIKATHFFIEKTHVAFAQTFIVFKVRDFFISKTNVTFTQTFII